MNSFLEKCLRLITGVQSKWILPQPKSMYSESTITRFGLNGICQNLETAIQRVMSQNLDPEICGKMVYLLQGAQDRTREAFQLLPEGPIFREGHHNDVNHG